MVMEALLLHARSICLKTQASVLSSPLLSRGSGGCVSWTVRGYKKHVLPPKPLPSKLQDWRREHKEPVNPTQRGVLTDAPDYAYPDGRAAPAGQNQLRRATQHRAIMQRIVTLTQEVDLAERRHAEKQQQRARQQMEAERRRLRSKGTQTLNAD